MGIEKSMNSVTLDEVLQLSNFHKYIETYNDIVIGQSSVKTQLLKALLPLTLNDREKPVA